MPKYHPPKIDKLLRRGFSDGGSSAVRGKALEDLVCYLLGRIPGVTVVKRNAVDVGKTQEIDVACWNKRLRGGLDFLPYLLLVEAKNSSVRVSSRDVGWFIAKLEDMGLDFGILVARSGITGRDRNSSAWGVVAKARRNGVRIAVLTQDDVASLRHTDDFAGLVQRKLCELVLLGTL